MNKKYVLTFKVPSLTADIVHTVCIEDYLVDTWKEFTIGKVPKELTEVDKDAHNYDINVWFDDSKSSKKPELAMALYTLYYDGEYITIYGIDSIKATIISVDSKEFTKENNRFYAPEDALEYEET